jgi:hypothetical protein
LAHCVLGALGTFDGLPNLNVLCVARVRS